MSFSSQLAIAGGGRLSPAAQRTLKLTNDRRIARAPHALLFDWFAAELRRWAAATHRRTDMILRMLLLIAAMRLVASLRSLPAAALLIAAACVAFLVRDRMHFQEAGTWESRDSAQAAISSATLCLAIIALTPPAVTIIRIGLILVAGVLAIWAALRYNAPGAAAPD
jgi:hypothetical protein